MLVYGEKMKMMMPQFRFQNNTQFSKFLASLGWVTTLLSLNREIIEGWDMENKYDRVLKIHSTYYGHRIKEKHVWGYI
jgi:CRISPR/Cas system-associated protein endoribonuclease Cas2